MYLLKYKIETVKQNTYLLVNSFTPLAIGRTEKFCLSALSLSLLSVLSLKFLFTLH